MFDMIESKPEYTDKSGLSLFQLFDGDLMPIFEEVFSRFQTPDKCNGQYEDQRIYPVRNFQMRVLEIETSGFQRSKKHLNSPAFAI